MPYKTKICENCSSSFVEEQKNQELCNECELLEELGETPTYPSSKVKYTPVYRRKYKRK